MRDPSPALEALSVSDVKSDSEVLRIWPRSTFSLLAASDDGSGEETEDDVGVQEIEDDVGVQESWGDNDELGQVMERNTECNALIPADLADQDLLDMPDPLSEGMIAIVPPEPCFPSTLNHSARMTRARGRNRSPWIRRDQSSSATGARSRASMGIPDTCWKGRAGVTSSPAT